MLSASLNKTFPSFVILERVAHVRSWCDGSPDLSLMLFQPVLHDYDEGRGVLWNNAYKRMVHIIGMSSPCGGSGFLAI